jgi:hypothetical protein
MCACLQKTREDTESSSRVSKQWDGMVYWSLSEMQTNKKGLTHGVTNCSLTETTSVSTNIQIVFYHAHVYTYVCMNYVFRHKTSRYSSHSSMFSTAKCKTIYSTRPTEDIVILRTLYERKSDKE